MAADLEKSGFRNGCPIATTALETAAQSDVLARCRRAAHSKAGSKRSRAGSCVSARKQDDAAIAATTILSQVEGALLLARTYRSVEPLRRAEAAVKLLAAGQAMSVAAEN